MNGWIDKLDRRREQYANSTVHSHSMTKKKIWEMDSLIDKGKDNLEVR